MPTTIRADEFSINDTVDESKRLKLDLSGLASGQVRTVTVAPSGPMEAHTHPASEIVSGTVATARLGSGTADGTTFLRGDQTWAVPAGGGGADTHGQATVDFSTGAESATVTVADASVATSSRIVAQMAYAPASGRDLDELEMDAFECLAGNIVAGVSFDILVHCRTGYGHGAYLVSWERN